MALNTYMGVKVNHDDTHDIRVVKAAPAREPWKSFIDCMNFYTSYHTPEEIGIAPEHITEYDTVLKELSYIRLYGRNDKEHALHMKSMSLHCKWKAAAHRWRAWKRRQAAIAAWEE